MNAYEEYKYSPTAKYLKKYLNAFIHKDSRHMNEFLKCNKFFEIDTICFCSRAKISSEEMRDNPPSSSTSKLSTPQPVIRQRKKPHMLPPLEQRRNSVRTLIYHAQNKE
jgi:hypothetical protein